MVLHGGFWRARYRLDLMRDLCLDLAGRGYAAWNLEYRRLGPLSRGGWPATFEDVAAGTDRLADVQGLDLRTVVAIGHSAGGHLALWTAARARLHANAPGTSPRVRVTHVVAQAGISDLEEAARLRLSAGAAAQLLGGSPEQQPERYAVASPTRLLPLGVPQLLVHGEDDAIVPVQMSRDFHALARHAGYQCDLAALPSIGHFEHLDPSSAAWRAVTDWLPPIG
jgi:acetyl esterase/lipase